MAVVGNLGLKNLFKKGQAMAKAVEAKVVQESGGIKTHTGGRGVNALRSNLHGTPKSYLPQVPHIQPVVGAKLKSNAWNRSKPAKKIRRGVYDLGQQIDRIRLRKDRQKLLGIAEHLGVTVKSAYNTGIEELDSGIYADAFSTSLNTIFVRDHLLKTREGMNIFAHELGHAIQHKTNPDYFDAFENWSGKLHYQLQEKVDRAIHNVQSSLGENLPREEQLKIAAGIVEKPSIQKISRRNYTAAMQATLRHEADAWEIAEKEFPRLAKHKSFKRNKQEGLASYKENRDIFHPESSFEREKDGMESLSLPHYNKGTQKGNNWFDKFMTNSRDNWRD